ncbi:hypothetical protein ACQPZF_27230 [Actinosynnema sp. CS-041913]|uniref:hypothetical protein n=1 Tax=Actinosynnema sp. CS-041913 TaxID=3239917 RepID=UPI003D94AB0F
MNINQRITRWAKTACTLLDAVRSVLISARRLVITATALTAAITLLITQVVPMLR